MAVKGRSTVIAHGGGQEVILNIRPLHALVRADKGARFKVVCCAKTGFGQHPPGANPGLADRVQTTVQRDGLGAAILEIDLQVILQVCPHTWQVNHRHDTSVFQHLRRPNAGPLEQCGRADRARGKNDFTGRHNVRCFAILGDFNARRFGPIKDHALRHHTGNDGQVGPLSRWRKIGIRRGLPDATSDVHLHGRKALLLMSVIVFCNRIARLLAGLDKGVIEGVHLAVVSIANTNGALAPAIGIIAPSRGFHAAVVREQTGIIPPLCPGFFPLVQIPRTAADIGHAIDRR